MKLSTGACFAVLFTSLFYGFATRSEAWVGRGDDPERAPDRGIIYSAVLNKATYRSGEPIQLSLSFENPTEAAVTIWLSGFWPNHEILVTDDAGEEPPLTEDGKRRRAAFAPDGERDKNAPRVLSPGMRYRDAKGLDLTDLYRFEKGTYQVRAAYHDMQEPTPLYAATKAIAFEVK